MSPNPSVRFHRFFQLIFFALLVAGAIFTLLIVPNTATDRLVSLICTRAFGRPIELRGVQCEFPTRGSLVFRVREIDFRPMWQAVDSAASRFVRQYDLGEWLNVRDTLWIFKPGHGVWYLRLLKAQAGEAQIRGGLSWRQGRMTRWNGAIRLPKKLSERFPQILGKRFSQDTLGRLLLKMTWADGQWRLWGRSGPVLEAKWQ